jgi:hypothetical protein
MSLRPSIYKTTDAGHGRIEERISCATEDIAWFKERHPDWRGLRSIALSHLFEPVRRPEKQHRKPVLYSPPESTKKLLTMF